MAMIKLTRKDFGINKVLPQDWYPVIVEGYTTQAKKDDPDVVIHVFTIKGDPDPAYAIPEDAREVFPEMRFKKYVSENGMFGMVALLKACFPGENFDDLEEVNIDPQKMLGKRIAAYIKPETYQQRIQNSLADFRPR